MAVVLLGFALLAATTFGLGYFFGGRTKNNEHFQIRSVAIFSQAEQAGQVGSILVGDSLAELAYLPQICGGSVLNAGVGAVKTREVIDLLRNALRHVKATRVLIAIGVNDAGRNYPTDVKSFTDNYRELVSVAKAAGAQIIVATIAPISDDLPLGSRIFDMALIKRFNDEIRGVATEFKTRIAETYGALAGTDGFLPRGFTVDGVHLTRAGYQRWTRALEESACGP